MVLFIIEIPLLNPGTMLVETYHFGSAPRCLSTGSQRLLLHSAPELIHAPMVVLFLLTFVWGSQIKHLPSALSCGCIRHSSVNASHTFHLTSASDPSINRDQPAPIFFNPSGMYLYRYNPPSDVTNEVRSRSISVTNGIWW